jgi:hypothetical protein
MTHDAPRLGRIAGEPVERMGARPKPTFLSPK